MTANEAASGAPASFSASRREIVCLLMCILHLKIKLRGEIGEFIGLPLTGVNNNSPARHQQRQPPGYFPAGAHVKQDLILMKIAQTSSVSFRDEFEASCQFTSHCQAVDQFVLVALPNVISNLSVH